MTPFQLIMGLAHAPGALGARTGGWGFAAGITGCMSTDASDENLEWKTQGAYELAGDGRCLYVRESGESVIWGTLFGLALMAGAGFLGWRLLGQEATGSKAVGIGMLVVAAALAGVAVWQVLGAIGLTRARTRSPLVVFDRGGTGGGGEIRFAGRSVAADRVRSLSTRPAEGGQTYEMLRRVVVAELHDGTEEMLGLHATSNWPAHYAQQGAQWMGLPYRPADR